MSDIFISPVKSAYTLPRRQPQILPYPRLLRPDHLPRHQVLDQRSRRRELPAVYLTQRERGAGRPRREVVPHQPPDNLLPLIDTVLIHNWP